MPSRLAQGIRRLAKVPDNTVGAGDIQDLAVAIEQLASEVQVLTQTLDELRDDVVWSLRNLLASQPLQPHRILTSMPLDPGASDWGDRLNRYNTKDLPEDEGERINAGDHHAAQETGPLPGEMPAAAPIAASKPKTQSAPQRKLF